MIRLGIYFDAAILFVFSISGCDTKAPRFNTGEWRVSSLETLLLGGGAKACWDSFAVGVLCGGPVLSGRDAW